MAGPLGIRDDVELTDDQRRTLEYIGEFDLTEEVKAAVEAGALEEDEAEPAEEELKRFLALAYLERERGRPLAPSGKIDAAWHMFILNTPAYHTFCDRVFQDYLHHVPTRVGGPEVAVMSGREAIDRYFEGVDSRIWEGRARICFVWRNPRRP